MSDLKGLFYPKSVAVVGASENVFKWGSIILTNIVDGGFGGKVYPVARGKDTVYGLKAYDSLKDVPEAVDLVMIATPASTVMGILADCVEMRINNIVVVSSGFSETGDEGREFEEKLIAFSESRGLNVVGPNTMGIANVKHGLYSMFSHIRLNSGGISIIAQSGNVGNQVMMWAEQQNIGISKFVGSGNEGVLRCEDYLEYFHRDEDTSVILFYVEGVDDGRTFIDVARRTSLEKPIIALKAGRTEIGSRAAQSHTGALSGSYRVFDGVMRQSGIIQAKTPTELLSLAAAFDSLPLPQGNRVGVITLGGGWGGITADECEERGLVLRPLPEDVFTRLDRMLPPFWSRGNPIDLVGQPDVNLFRESIEAVVASDAFDAVIFLGIIGSFQMALRFNEASCRLGQGSFDQLEVFEKTLSEMELAFLDNIIDLMETYKKPIYPVALVAKPGDASVHMREGYRHKVIIYKTPEEAVLCLEKQYKYYRYIKRQEEFLCVK